MLSKVIPLTRGQFAIVDADVFLWASLISWHAEKRKHTFYAARKIAGRTSYMHREICFSEAEVHHKDGNGLNNIRRNLRPATRAQNMHGFLRTFGSSTFRGVSWSREKKKWLAKITVNYRQIFLGRFSSEKEAARAYDAAAKKYFGEFASPNF